MQDAKPDAPCVWVSANMRTSPHECVWVDYVCVGQLSVRVCVGGGLRRARKGQEYQHEQESVKN